MKRHTDFKKRHFFDFRKFGVKEILYCRTMKDPKSLLSGRSGDPDARLGDSLPLRETSLYKSGRVDISAAHGSWDEQSINSTEFHGKRYLQWAQLVLLFPTYGTVTFIIFPVTLYLKTRSDDNFET